MRSLSVGVVAALALLAFLAFGCAAEPAEDDTQGSQAAVSGSSRDAVVGRAREDRLVGELATGYLGLVTDAALTDGQAGPSDLKARVQHINIQRRAVYTEAAVARHSTVQQMAESTACLLFRDRVKVGEAYRTEAEEWKLHTADAPVETPSFCVAR